MNIFLDKTSLKLFYPLTQNVYNTIEDYLKNANYESYTLKLDRFILFFFMSISFLQIHSSEQVDQKKHKCHKHKRERIYRSRINKFGFTLGNIVADALLLQRYLFSVETAKIFTGFVPFFLVARQIDEDVQSRFYDPQCHKNINQFPKHCHNIAKNGVGVPMVVLSSLVIFAPNEDLRQTARMFAIGLPFVHSGKNVIKKLRSKCCLRPWNEDFSREKRSSGGFPSGHMANVTYAATLFGIRHGIKWAAPLSLLAAFIFADFVNCNRHYLSQIIAGAGLGVIYAVAANQVIQRKLSDCCSCSMGFDRDGRSTMKVSYTF